MAKSGTNISDVSKFGCNNIIRVCLSPYKNHVTRGQRVVALIGNAHTKHIIVKEACKKRAILRFELFH